MTHLAVASVLGAFGVAAVFAACGGSQPKANQGNASDPHQAQADDRSLCEAFVHWKSDPRLEISETLGPNAIKPNIRRVYKVIGVHDDRHTVLLCREIDTNFDGIKDVVRTFNEKGEPLLEEADTNYDAKIDDWVNFTDGRIEEEDVDTTLSAGRPNLWKFYVNGELSRIRRNLHCASGKPDTWEIYYKNRLERVGNDTTCDGHVDRWDRDAQLLAQEEAQQSVEIVDGGGGSAPVILGPNGEVLEGGLRSIDAGPKKRPNR